MACRLSWGVVPLVVAQPDKRMPKNNANNPILHSFMTLSLSIDDKKLNVF
jgi:hypothetical protein